MRKITWRRWAAWIMGLTALILLAVAGVLLYRYAPWKANLEVETGAFWLDALVLMGAPVLGLLIALRQPQNRYGWLWLVYSLASAVVAIGAAIYYLYGAQRSGYPLPVALLLWAYVPATYLSILSFPLFALWFPTGQAPTPRWRFLEWWLAIDLLLFTLGAFTAGATSGFTVVIDNPLGFLPERIASATFPIAWFSLIPAALLAAASVFFRYRGAGSVERQQIKWFMLGAAGLVSEFMVVFIPIDNPLLKKIYNDAMLLIVYGAIGTAILRYRLWDIDVIIRRTLVYGALSITLGMAYFGSVLLLQGLFETLTGLRQSPIATVLSTLLIAALFSPLRRRVQEGVDRRFYRKKYDAEQALAAFAAAARDEVDIERISLGLVNAINNTVQPAAVSLWLKPVGRGRPESDS